MYGWLHAAKHKPGVVRLIALGQLQIRRLQMRRSEYTNNAAWANVFPLDYGGILSFSQYIACLDYLKTQIVELYHCNPPLFPLYGSILLLSILLSIVIDAYIVFAVKQATTRRRGSAVLASWEMTRWSSWKRVTSCRMWGMYSGLVPFTSSRLSSPCLDRWSMREGFRALLETPTL